MQLSRQRLPKESRRIPLQHDSLPIRRTKEYPSAFFGTNLATQLTALGVDTLVVAGFTTSGAVRATTLDAMQAGLRAMVVDVVDVVDEAVGDRRWETHRANLMDVGAKYGDVVTLEAAVEALRGTRERGWKTK